MKAAVAVPPVRDFYLTRKRFSALGSQLVTRLLSDLGVPSELFIFPLLKEKGTRIPLPHPLSYLQEFVLEEEKGQTSFFRHYHHFGPSFSDCARMIHESGADILFLSCFAFCYASETLSLSAEVKRRIPELPVVVGGAGVSVYPEYFLREDSIDFALTGEAEVCLEEFLRALTKHRSWQSVPNLYWKDGARIRAPRITSQTDSDTIRIPWRLMHNGENSLLFSTVLSRGCDRTCRSCSISLSHGKGFRMPSPATISRTFDEMAQAAAGGNAGRNVEVKINFEDDNLLFAAESVEGHLLTLSSRFDKVSFYGENGFDLSLLSPARVRKLIGLGMRQFNLSIASTNRSSLDRESRNFQPRLYETIMAELRSGNIPSVTYFICGLKGDTTETVSDNLVFLARHPTLIGISSFYTVPGMPDFAERSSFDVVP
ncbi:MAG TPA: cobalamin-dependent protein, partial [Spirochaetia bacterium]|nr:cobalamin-dependent protein [Spirochaetia bacterium]